ncbi:hypothetical protein SIN8267_01833 [Sinobacterium norvegicum]|uniref:Uncharacterized protein n=1 Tax=Sinobacterium norvegicum TaxID=1641715 RepID=A0ABN8EKI0_9GAMM|nr:hypothetical protein [Sinobacterium norvegicum]CAH0991719.1 hypothetical protein SIN8267_01833 [Sinobacterium norvegicum]
MDTSDIIASISAVIAAGSLIYTIQSNKGNREIAQAAYDHTKKAGTTDLVAAWKGIRAINPESPITPQVDNALRALQLTAGYWLHDIIEKDIIYAQAWTDYQSIYDALKVCEIEIPGTGVTGKSTLTKEMGDAYAQMNAYKKE